LPILLHPEPVTSSRLLTGLIHKHLPGEEKRLMIICESFDSMTLMDIQCEIDERLNMVVVEWPGAAVKERTDEIVAITGAKIVTPTYDQTDSPFGTAASCDLDADNVVTLSNGQAGVVINDAREVIVIHSTEDDEENPEEQAAREAAETAAMEH